MSARRWEGILGAAICLTVSLASAAGLSTPYADIQRTILVGRKVEVLDAQGHGLRLRNLGDRAVLVQITPLSPTVEQLRGGAAPLPDLGWIRLSTGRVLLAPRDEVEVKVTVKIPQKAAYIGKTYQVMLWSRTIPDGTAGIAVNAGLLSRIRLQTEK